MVAATSAAALPLLALVAPGLVVVPPASAVTPSLITQPAIDTGNYCFFSGPTAVDICENPHDPGNTEYITGYIDILSGAGEYDLSYRGFFVFDLATPEIAAALAGGHQLVNASLRTQNFTIECGLLGDQCPQTVRLYGVNGSIADLVAGTSSFDDLGQGLEFGSTVFPEILPPTSVSTYLLNADGLNAIRSALGAQVALSARNSDEVGGVQESPIYVYGGSENSVASPSVFLDLEFQPRTNVPAPLPLFGAGVAWRWSRRLRRRLG